MKLQQAKDYIAQVGVEVARKELKDRRELSRHTQLSLSKLSGVQQSAINRIESGKGPLTPRTFAKLMTVIERFSKGVAKNKKERNSFMEARSAVAKAKNHVSICERLPWMRSEIPKAQEALAKAQEALAALDPKAKKQEDVFENPFVREVMESYERELSHMETDVLEIVEKAAGTILVEIMEKVARREIVEHGDRLLAGDQSTIEAHLRAKKELEETGEIKDASFFKIKSIEKIGKLSDGQSVKDWSEKSTEE